MCLWHCSDKGLPANGIIENFIPVVGKHGPSQEPLHHHLLIPFYSNSAHINRTAHSERESTDHRSQKFSLPLTFGCVVRDKQGANAFYKHYLINSHTILGTWVLLLSPFADED